MRCAILGDIHANIQALDAVIADAREYGCEEIHCLGDVVGYNANPAECVETVRSLPGFCVQGNHDEAAAGEGSLDHFSATASASLLWTRQMLNADQKHWLASLRTVRQIRRTTIVHATLDSPVSWGYVRTQHEAELSLSCQRTPLCFFGHTHVPGIFIQGAPAMLPINGVQLPHAGKLLINAGSVGQPRDGDWRAAYLIHDEETGGLWLRRVEYDVEAAVRAVTEAGLPQRLVERLRTGS
jgi:predicted phosphodiesterase